MKIKVGKEDISVRHEDWNLIRDLKQKGWSDTRLMLEVVHWVAKREGLSEELISSMRDIHNSGYPMVK